MALLPAKECGSAEDQRLNFRSWRQRNKPRIPHYPPAGPVGVDMVKDQSESRDGSINELAASIASKLVRNAPIDPEPGDPQKADGLIGQSERQDDKVPRPREATVMHNQPPYRKESSDEYRQRADACLNWAREASTDEVRLACLTLANAWLKAAMSEDGGMSDHLPLAPRL
jgi:hypothetical protein